jgi:hypothetical protein
MDSDIDVPVLIFGHGLLHTPYFLKTMKEIADSLS